MSNVFPYVVSFREKTTGGPTHRRQHVILIESSRSRKKDWVLRAKDGWDTEWSTVVNVSQRFEEFFKTHQIEKTEFPRACGGTYEAERDFYGTLGYTHNTFFWNLMRWGLVEAIRGTFVSVLEDETNALTPHFEKMLKEIPAPDEVKGKEVERLEDPSGLAPALVWVTQGLNFNYPYISTLEEVYKSISLNIDANF